MPSSTDNTVARANATPAEPPGVVSSAPIDCATDDCEPRRPPRYRYVRRRWRIAAAVIDAVGWAIVWLIAQARRIARIPSRAIATEPERILLVQLDHLGDAILTTAMLPALRRRFPRARIEVLAAAWNQDVFRLCPEVDEIHVSARNRFARGGRRRSWLAATLWWGWRLRRRKYCLAIDVRGEFPLALMLWLCGAQRRVGWGCGGGGFLLTDSVAWVPDRPELDSRGAILRTLGIDEDIAADLRPRITPPAEARHEVAARAKSWGHSRRWRVVIHVGAGTAAKRWPVEHWRRLVAQLVVEHRAQIVLVGGGEETATARAIHAGVAWPAVVDWTGRLSLAQLAALLELSDVFVGADSGPAHLAAAVGTPSVVLFSGANRAAQWRPRGERVAIVRNAVACSPCHREECPLGDHPCMRGLAPAAVVGAVEGLLRGEIPEANHDRSLA